MARRRRGWDVASGGDTGFQYESMMLVEFAPTEIGGVTYLCPAHGVTLVKFYDLFANLGAQPPPIAYRISQNDVSFSNYHVFRSNSRIVTGAAGP